MNRYAIALGKRPPKASKLEIPETLEHPFNEKRICTQCGMSLEFANFSNQKKCDVVEKAKSHICGQSIRKRLR